MSSASLHCITLKQQLSGLVISVRNPAATWAQRWSGGALVMNNVLRLTLNHLATIEGSQSWDVCVTRGIQEVCRRIDLFWPLRLFTFFFVLLPFSLPFLCCLPISWHWNRQLSKLKEIMIKTYRGLRSTESYLYIVEGGIKTLNPDMPWSLVPCNSQTSIGLDPIRPIMQLDSVLH